MRNIPFLNNYSEYAGLKVFVYFNLRKKLWSVRSKGKVLFHTDQLVILDARLKVSEPGRLRVLDTQTKNVHAGVEGTLKDWSPTPPHGEKISYNPYNYKHFYKPATLAPVYEAEEVWMCLHDDNKSPHVAIKETI